MLDYIRAYLLRSGPFLLHRKLYTSPGRVVVWLLISFGLAMLYLTYLAPSEMLFQWIDKAAYWWALVGLAVGMVALLAIIVGGLSFLSGLLVWNFGKGLSFEWQPLTLSTTKEIGQGLSLGGDIFVKTEYHGEDPEDVKKRFMEHRASGKWIVVIPHLSQNGFWFKGEEMETFDRAILPMGSVDAEFKNAVDFSRETWEDYAAYLIYFASYYRARIAEYKLALAAPEEREDAFFRTLIKPMTVFFLFVSLSLSAQNASLLSADISGIVPPNHASVSYVFKAGQYKRVGDGRSTIKTLLVNGQYYDSTATCGKFVSVSVNGLPAKQTVTTARIERIATVGGPVDTSTYQEKMERLKMAGDEAGIELKEKGALTWDVAWHWFGIIKLALFSVWTVFWLWAGFGAKETVQNAMGRTVVGRKIAGLQQSSGSMAFGISGLFASMYLVQFAFYVSTFDTITEFKCVIIFVAAWALKEICAKIHPNVPIITWNGNNKPTPT